MKKKQKWSFYLIESSTSEIKRIAIPRIVILLCFIILISGIIGFVRSVYFIATYGYARFGFYNEHIENRELLNKVSFLNKLAEEYQGKIDELIVFEDNARVKFGMNPISKEIRLAGVGGRPSFEEILNASLEDPEVRKANEIEENIKAQLRQISLQDTTFSRMADHIRTQHDRWAQCPSIWPTQGRITSGFGYRYHPFTDERIFHEGIDIANKTWTPVVATADGICSFVGNRKNYGITVIVNHRGSGYTTVYAHLKQPAVTQGQFVKRGELVGYLGNTGRSTGPHLHYEVRKLNRHMNPMNYILPVDVVVD